MADGRVVATGSPKDIVTAELIEQVYGLQCVIIDDPITGSPMVIPSAPSAGPRDEVRLL